VEYTQGINLQSYYLGYYWYDGNTYVYFKGGMALVMPLNFIMTQRLDY